MRSSSSASYSSSSSRCDMGLFYRREKCLHRALFGHGQVRIELRERLEDEAAFVEARMRDREPRLLDHLVPVEQQVEVDRARAEARAVACPAELAFHRQKQVEQRARLELGL